MVNILKNYTDILNYLNLGNMISYGNFYPERSYISRIIKHDCQQ